MSANSLAQITFRANPRLKEKTLSKTQKDGITLRALFSFAMQAYVNDELIVGLRHKNEVPSPYLINAIKEAEDQYQNGEMSPRFDNARDAVKWLRSKKKNYGGSVQ